MSNTVKYIQKRFMFTILIDEDINHNNISQLCINVLKQLENNQNHFGDAAIDFVIDNDNNVWLLEINFNYAAEIKINRTVDEQRILPNILPTPFEYAKALTGF